MRPAALSQLLVAAACLLALPLGLLGVGGAEEKNGCRGYSKGEDAFHWMCSLESSL